MGDMMATNHSIAQCSLSGDSAQSACKSEDSNPEWEILSKEENAADEPFEVLSNKVDSFGDLCTTDDNDDYDFAIGGKEEKPSSHSATHYPLTAPPHASSWAPTMSSVWGKKGGPSSLNDMVAKNMDSSAANSTDNDKTTSELKNARMESRARKLAYQQQTEKPEKNFYNATEGTNKKIQRLERELNAVQKENDGLRRGKQTLTAQVHNLEVGRNKANSAIQKLTKRLNIELEEHGTKIDKVTASLSLGIEKLMTDQKMHVDNLLQEMDSERKTLEENILSLNEENDDLKGKIVDLSLAKKKAVGEIRHLEEELSDADGAIDDAKRTIKALQEKKQILEDEVTDAHDAVFDAQAAVETLLEEKEATEARFSDMKNKKIENQSKMYSVLRENDELIHTVTLLGREKGDALEKISTLEQEVDQYVCQLFQNEDKGLR